MLGPEDCSQHRFGSNNSNQKSFSAHTKPCNMVITLQGKTANQTGAKENEAGLDQGQVNMAESCERVCRGVWDVTTGDRCTLCSGALPTWRGSGTFGRAVGVWLLQEVTVDAALTWSTQRQHIPMMQGEGRGGEWEEGGWGVGPTTNIGAEPGFKLQKHDMAQNTMCVCS